DGNGDDDVHGERFFESHVLRKRRARIPRRLGPLCLERAISDSGCSEPKNHRRRSAMIRFFKMTLRQARAAAPADARDHGQPGRELQGCGPTRRGHSAARRDLWAAKKYPQLGFVGTPLLDAYTKASDAAKPGTIARVVALMQELLADARVTLPKESPELAGQLAAFSQTVLGLKAWDEAEPLIREALTIREAKAPDDWRTFNTKSMLG